MSVKPEDVLPDDQNFAEVNGIKIRKGTVAAALANADILQSSSATKFEKIAAKKILVELAPALVVLHKHLTWKNPEIQHIIEEALNKPQ